jgi:uncharacterized phage protein gp47/JayE
MANGTLRIGELYSPSGSNELRDDYLNDIELGARQVGVSDPPIGPGSDWFVAATAISKLGMLGFGNLRISADNANVLYATGPALDEIRAAYGLPVVPASPSTGQVRLTVSGTSTVADGTELVYPNGLRGKVVGTWNGVTNGDEVDVQSIDTGEGTNLDPDTEVEFVTPPLNVATVATVSRSIPLTGGQDEETDERKRARILNRLRNRPSGGNWGYIRELALNALVSVQDCYVYPALGGPASFKAVPVREYQTDRNDYSRTLDDAALRIVRQAIQDDMPDGVEAVVQAVADESCDVSVKVSIPDSTLAGGNGTGWLDETPWPNLAGADTRILVSAISSDKRTLTMGAATTTVDPLPGITHVAWWSPTERKFHVFTVVAENWSGANTITLDRPVVDGTGVAAASGDYVSPAAVNMAGYGDTFVSEFMKLGPGENISGSTNAPRDSRHPFTDVEDPAGLTLTMLAAIINAHPEVTDAAWSYRFPNTTGTPTVPGSVNTAPNVLVPRHLGVYKQ